MTPPRPRRKVILHHHLFKNAGTSVDELLRACFGSRWVTREFAARANPAPHRREVAEWIREHPEAVAFSSHTVELPPPDMGQVDILPVIFIRHPIDRIASAYAFERKQGGDGFGSVLARHTTLAGYIEVRLSMGRDRQCRNFHVSRFAPMFPPAEGTEFERASRAVETLPFVGVVEEFDRSMALLQSLVQQDLPEFVARSVHANVSRDTSAPLEERLERLRAEVGEACYTALLTHNADDLRLHEQALARLRART
ncbi:sulfotransferase family 2 domain-containing protein [Ideonella sp. 4Y16]|uniref:Sulfotransferase family 2 domain-containing protein n=1 Tax=Ideonella alba TaxID=2824118 RepID=A0A940YB91_9BURK|nr:sulfotransferase family 2 domain-containing protein [Ideonella alba]MBQ0929135.1 sulfotransferase family 2 domain-containing protein [Ideonella alba]MBQ0943081.1 sulfotransferase family 2 domain-containing protein [Ideonella alba]